MDNGWIKLYRVLLDKYIWLRSTPEQKVILITLLLMANHEPHKWMWNKKDYEVQKGQFITSTSSIVQKCGRGVSTQNVRSALKKFEELDFLTIESTNTNSLITITNWEEYQPKNDKVTNEPTRNQQATNKEVTKNQQRGNKEVTTNKNDKNDKNERSNTATSKISSDSISSKFEINKDWAEVVFDWLEYKKERRETYKSDRSVKSFITKLRNLSANDPGIAKQIIEQSFAQNYAGVFELKNNNNEKTNRATADTIRR